MPSPEYDLEYLQSGLLDLQGYLLSKELYWPIGSTPPRGEPPYPRMTLGNLLLARRRLESQQMTGGQKEEFGRLAERLERSQKEWAVAWEQKAQREFSARLNLWRDFLEDYRRKPPANVDRYQYEVTRRAVLELLIPVAKDIPSEEQELLSGLDAFLKAVFSSGPFVWEDHIQEAFPQTKFWFLYGAPKKDEQGAG
jgi:hypothetical protein